MRRLPVIPTLIVGLACAAMIALGVWQLARRAEKEAAIAQLAANIGRPPVAFPASGTGDSLLFRRSSVVCGRVTDWQRLSGRDAGGRSGWRIIGRCGRVPVQFGIAGAPDATPQIARGPVAGFLSHAPDGRSILEQALRPAPRRLMLVATTPPAGLRANAPPDLSAVPNNHLAYAVQWFFFAGVAAVIYALALRRRRS